MKWSTAILGKIVPVISDTLELMTNKEKNIDSRYQRLEDKLLPKHVGFNIEISRWAEPRHSNSQLDTNIRSFTNIGDDSLSKILTVVSAFKDPGVKNVTTGSDPRARRLMKPSIDRVGFINHKWNGGMYDCRVTRKHSFECFHIRVHSQGRKDSVSMMGNRTDSHTESPDIVMETQLEFHQMYEYTRLVEPLVVTKNKKCQNHGIIRGLHGLAHSEFHSMCECTRSVEPLVATTNMKYLNHGFI